MARSLITQMTTHYERRGNVAVLQIDNPPVNGLGHATRKSLIDGLGRALRDDDVRSRRDHRHRQSIFRRRRHQGIQYAGGIGASRACCK